MTAFLAEHGEEAGTYTDEQFDDLAADIRVTGAQFEQARTKVTPSITDEVREFYERFSAEFGGVVTDSGDDIRIGYA
jgi:histidinol dehydrogenase